MTVTLWLRGDANPVKVEGNLIEMTNRLNISAANGAQYAILDSEDGPLMIQSRLIIKAQGEDADSFFA